VASFILEDWENQLKHFIKVFPQEYKKVLRSAPALGGSAPAHAAPAAPHFETLKAARKNG
jgi:glutamate synthase domain-containing protein 3